MIVDVFKAIVYAGIPIAIISYYLIVLTQQKTALKPKNPKKLKQDNLIQQMVYKKWLKFGTGFYGVVAFITYVHIEIYQIIEFIRNFDDFQHFIDNLGFSMILGFFIEALMNFITAFMWPIYWYKYLPIGSFWIWVTIAILSHSIATKYALTKNVADKD